MPFIVALVVLAEPTSTTVLVGVLMAVPVELLRAWAARSIGPASHTREPTPGPLALTGPYRRSRNPLYVANIALYACFAVASGWWPGLVLPLLMLPYYQLIVRWEEARLLAVHGQAYADLCARVPRWFGPARAGAPDASAHASWRAALRAERGTLLALLLVFGALAGRGLWAG